jgi:hypothetical protein
MTSFFTHFFFKISWGLYHENIISGNCSFGNFYDATTSTEDKSIYGSIVFVDQGRFFSLSIYT